MIKNGRGPAWVQAKPEDSRCSIGFELVDREEQRRSEAAEMCSQNRVKREPLELSKLTQDKCGTVSLWVSELRRCQRAHGRRERVIVLEKGKDLRRH